MAAENLLRAGLVSGDVHAYRLASAPQTLTLPVGQHVEPASELHLAVFPELDLPDFAACRLGLSTVLDGQPVDLHDQHGHQYRAGTLGCLVADQWNLLRLDLTEFAGGHLDQIVVELPPGRGHGWLQVLGVHPVPVEPADVVEQAITTRGSNSTFEFSRGNTYPSVNLPHGFVFCAPVSDARSDQWFYRWGDGRDALRLEGLALCHQPSPWLRDRASCQVMPWFGEPVGDPNARVLHFDHREEQAHPHRYRVPLHRPQGNPTGDQVIAELTPTEHGAAFRFNFSGPTAERGVLFDQQGAAELVLFGLPDGRAGLRWWLKSSDQHPGAWVYGETMQVVELWPPTRRGLLRSRPPGQRAVRLVGGDLLEVRLAQSMISVEQARHAFELELRGPDFDALVSSAHDAWSQILGRLELRGGSQEQRTAVWSNLARLFSWPNAHHENLGNPAEPRWAYASPFHARKVPDNAERGGLPVLDGQLFVNNGYWDTYRTAWPAYHLLMPRHASRLLDGICQAYRDSGWMSRWSAPGHHDTMVGTSSDAIFADAAAHGIQFDQPNAYASALRNALAPSEHAAVGRKQLHRARYVGWVDRSTPEGFSWSIENGNCDAAIAAWSTRLATADPQRATEYLTNAAYFANRALAWRALFDPATGFLRGRDPDGSFPARFNPLEWGGDYTETNAWGMAFSVVWDGAGLADAYGGEAGLAAKLDEARATPETAQHPSSYGFAIHEMVEARALRLGQFAISNQPAHHAPYMYLHAGRPDATQRLLAEISDRVLIGSEIGQGYPGDEDNGEMSAWQLFVLFGLYPLQVGSGQFVITTPVFDQVTWLRDDATTLSITATGQGDFIADVRINGQTWPQVWVDVATLDSDCTIEVTRSQQPTEWGRASRPASLSVRPDGRVRHWQPDRTPAATITPPAPTLVDDHGLMAQTIPAGMAVTFTWPEPFRPLCAALTFATMPPPDSWRLEAHVPGQGWLAMQPIEPQRANQTTPQPLPDQPMDAMRVLAMDEIALHQVEVF